VNDRDAMAGTRRCPVCEHSLVPLLTSWLARCDGCGLWASSLSPVSRASQSVDLAEWRPQALEALRRQNFARILDALDDRRSLAGCDLLEVGCGDGWFLELAAARGAHAVGLEPDGHVAASPRERGLDIRIGWFPDDLDAEDRYDVVVFNDVFEHLPDPLSALRECRAMLREGGLLVLNLPDSGGVLYRVACALARIRIVGPLGRLWQQGLESPHLFYFDDANLSRLCGRAGFRTVHRESLTSFRAQGLWHRIRLGGAGPAVAGFQWLVLAGVSPLLTRLAPPDILLQIQQAVEPE